MKILLSVSIPAFTLFVAGAWNMHRSQEPVAASHTDIPSVVAPSVETHPSMWANNATLYKGESFELHFTAPNPPYLGVLDPSGHFFYVVFPREAIVGNLKPLVDSEHFASMTSLRISTAALKADPYQDGVYTNQPVFTQSGTYTFILGENLHVDDPDLVHKVSIRYVHGKRPASSSASTDVAMN